MQEIRYPQAPCRSLIGLVESLSGETEVNILVNYLSYDGEDKPVSKRAGVLVGTECNNTGEVLGIIIDSATKRFRAHPINLVEYDGEFLDEDRESDQ